MNWRALDDSERPAAVADLQRWGYARPIDARELREAVWLRNELGLLWFDHGPLYVHGCAAPEHRGRVPLREISVLIRAMGRRLGASRVYSPVLSEDMAEKLGVPSMRAAAVRRLYRHRGWDGEDAIGPYVEVK